jgi:hypothetical protein
MPEPVKCPHCEEGEIYERSVSYAYSRIFRLPDGSIDYGHADALGDYDTDCWICLDCGATVDWAEQKAIYNDNKED